MKKGFTLIEFMIVFAIIAILAAIAVPLYTQSKVRNDQTYEDRVHDSSEHKPQIQNALNLSRYEIITVEGCRYITNKWEGGIIHLNTCECIKFKLDSIE